MEPSRRTPCLARVTLLGLVMISAVGCDNRTSRGSNRATPNQTSLSANPVANPVQAPVPVTSVLPISTNPCSPVYKLGVEWELVSNDHIENIKRRDLFEGERNGKIQELYTQYNNLNPRQMTYSAFKAELLLGLKDRVKNLLVDHRSTHPQATFSDYVARVRRMNGAKKRRLLENVSTLRINLPVEFLYQAPGYDHDPLDFDKDQAIKFCREMAQNMNHLSADKLQNIHYLSAATTKRYFENFGPAGDSVAEKGDIHCGLALRTENLPESVKNIFGQPANGQLDYRTHVVFAVTNDGDTVEVKATPLNVEVLEELRDDLNTLLFTPGNSNWHARRKNEIPSDPLAGAGHLHIGLNDAFSKLVNGRCELDMDLLKRFMLDYSLHATCFNQEYDDIDNAPMIYRSIEQNESRNSIENFVNLIKDQSVNSLNAFQPRYATAVGIISYFCRNEFEEAVEAHQHLLQQAEAFGDLAGAAALRANPPTLEKMKSCYKYTALSLGHATGSYNGRGFKAPVPTNIDPDGTLEIRSHQAFSSVDDYLNSYKGIVKRINELRDNAALPLGTDAELIRRLENIDENPISCDAYHP